MVVQLHVAVGNRGMDGKETGESACVRAVVECDQTCREVGVNRVAQLESACKVEWSGAKPDHRRLVEEDALSLAGEQPLRIGGGEQKQGDESGEDIEMDGSEIEALLIWVVGLVVVFAGAANS